MKKSIYLTLSILIMLTMILTACTPAAAPTAAPAPVQPTSAPAAAQPTTPPAAAPKNPGLASDAAKVAMQFFDQKEMDAELALIDKPALNPSDPIYQQYLTDTTIDTTKYKKPGPYNICFSNSGVGNPWRVVGMTDMNEEVKLHPADIKSFTNVDAQSKDEKQIADIADLVAGGKCDILIVAPNTTAALTPAIEAACKVLPVIEFDRYSLSDCAVVKERSIGGYAFGAVGAKFIVDNLPKGGNVLALRILPGVDVLEQRWGAARQIFEKAGNINVVGVEFGNGDNAKVKTIVADYLDRYKIDAVWMDAGATSVAALEAFADAGKPYPIITGEDQNDFLKYWKDNKLTAIAPTFSTYMWRTAILAALKVLKGEKVQSRWYLPQPYVTNATLDKYYNPKMPPLHYAMCGCEDMPTYPQAWGGTK